MAKRLEDYNYIKPLKAFRTFKYNLFAVIVGDDEHDRTTWDAQIVFHAPELMQSLGYTPSSLNNALKNRFYNRKPLYVLMDQRYKPGNKDSKWILGYYKTRVFQKDDIKYLIKASKERKAEKLEKLSDVAIKELNELLKDYEKFGSGLHSPMETLVDGRSWTPYIEYDVKKWKKMIKKASK